MGLALHPWFREARIAMRRDPRMLRRCGVVALVFVAGVALTFTRRGMLETVAAFLAAWPLQIGAAVAVASFVLTRSRLVRLVDEWHGGWWAAVPLGRHCIARSVIALTAIVTGVIGALLAGVLFAAIWIAANSQALPSLFAIEAGLLAGAAAGALTALRATRTERTRSNKSQPWREPLLRLTWLHDRRAPHLSDWQRREALQGWRSGGSFWLPGAALAAMPNGIPLGTVIGLLLLSVVTAWILVVLRAGSAVARDAQGLLAATPLSRKPFAAAALRYPWFTAACATLLSAIGIAMTGLGWRSLSIWASAVVAATWPSYAFLARRRRAGA